LLAILFLLSCNIWFFLQRKYLWCNLAGVWHPSILKPWSVGCLFLSHVPFNSQYSTLDTHLGSSLHTHAGTSSNLTLVQCNIFIATPCSTTCTHTFFTFNTDCACTWFSKCSGCFPKDFLLVFLFFFASTYLTVLPTFTMMARGLSRCPNLSLCLRYWGSCQYSKYL
jgi:hypothetical protein